MIFKQFSIFVIGCSLFSAAILTSETASAEKQIERQDYREQMRDNHTK